MEKRRTKEKEGRGEKEGEGKREIEKGREGEEREREDWLLSSFFNVPSPLPTNRLNASRNHWAQPDVVSPCHRTQSRGGTREGACESAGN